MASAGAGDRHRAINPPSAIGKDQVGAVNTGEATDKAAAFAQSNNLAFPVLLDSMGIHDFPTSIVIGRDGRVRHIQVGMFSPEALDAVVPPCCHNRTLEMEERMIKIAFPTDDGETISKHLGQARYFQVITLEGGQVQSSERRDKASHSHQDHQHEHEAGVHPGQQMIETIGDCQVLIAGGMGQPMYSRAVSRGMTVYLTGEDRISDAVQAYQQGNLTSDMRRIHMH